MIGELVALLGKTAQAIREPHEIVVTGIVYDTMRYSFAVDAQGYRRFGIHLVTIVPNDKHPAAAGWAICRREPMKKPKRNPYHSVSGWAATLNTAAAIAIRHDRQAMLNTLAAIPNVPAEVISAIKSTPPRFNPSELMPS